MTLVGKGVCFDTGGLDIKPASGMLRGDVLMNARRFEEAARAFAALTQEGINILMISTSEIKITILIQEKYVELAVRILHDTFGLDWDIG